MNLCKWRQKLCWTYLNNILNLLLQPNLLPMGRRKAAGPQPRLWWDRGDTRGLRRKRTLYLWRKVWYLTELKRLAADFSATLWTRTKKLSSERSELCKPADSLPPNPDSLTRLTGSNLENFFIFLYMCICWLVLVLELAFIVDLSNFLCCK